MSRRTVRLIVALLLLLAVFIVLQRAGYLPGSHRNAVANPEELIRFNFRMNRNEFGDRVLLHTRVKVRYTPREDAPDLIDITPKEGNFDGDFVWTLIPDQGGERRLLGEYFTNGRTYKVCEYLLRTKLGAGESAERYQPINNDGPRYHLPSQIDPAPLHALYDAILAEQPRLDKVAKGTTEAVAVSPELIKLAGEQVYYCLGNPLPGSKQP